MHDYTDTTWIHKLKSHDPQACADLWELLFIYADSLAWRYNPDLVRDAAMAAYQRILTRGVTQFQFRSTFKSYCKVIVVNEINRLYGRRLQQYEQHPSETLLNEEAIVGEMAEEALDLPSRQAILAVLHPCLSQLTEKERKVLEQLYLQEHAPQQVADWLELTRNYVNIIAHRARKKMQECLKSRGFFTAEDCL